MTNLDFLQRRQFVTRKRHPAEKTLEYSDYYDEYIGMTKTGNIVDSKGNIIATDIDLSHNETASDKQSFAEALESNPDFTPFDSVPFIEMRSTGRQSYDIPALSIIRYRIIVDTVSGICEYTCDEEEYITFDIDNYATYLETIYWKDFVKKITVQKLTEYDSFDIYDVNGIN